MGLISLEKGRLCGCLTAAPQYLLGARQDDIQVLHSDAWQEDKLKQERFRQDIKKSFFTLRTAKQGCLVSVPVGCEDPDG